ncbi:MAG: peptide chain release factor 2 [Sulfuricurvum sp. PC08-66]|nr:MAG: peptide chain release factor 2 [Sulfuricurvum sp. PC08-66]
MDNYEYSELLKGLKLKMGNITGIIKPDAIVVRLGQIEELEKAPQFWEDAAAAAVLQKEKTQQERKLSKYRATKSMLDDAAELYEMAKEERDEATLEELFKSALQLDESVKKMEIEVMLSGELDGSNAIISIHPGAGGTESQDWASMLYRMYSRWAERKGFKTEVLDYQDGEEAGIKDASMIIRGENVYGYLKHESGIHRLVRISPYDANAKRHTSFASVVVSPEVDDDIDIVVEEKDIRVDTYRSGGAGGQHVNKTESAIRITHIETNIVVQCQNDRSQHKNRATAMKMLKSRLYEYELAKQQAVKDGVVKSEIGWGHQIRSYVLAPYQQVKDNRSNEAYSQVNAILDGDIDQMMEDVLVALSQK